MWLSVLLLSVVVGMMEILKNQWQPGHKEHSEMSDEVGLSSQNENSNLGDS